MAEFCYGPQALVTQAVEKEFACNELEGSIEELVCDFSESAQLAGDSGADCGQQLRAELSAVNGACEALASGAREALRRARAERSTLLADSLLGALSTLLAKLARERIDANLDAAAADGERGTPQRIDLDELNAEFDFLKLLLSRCGEHKITLCTIAQQAQQLKVCLRMRSRVLFRCC